MRQQAHEVAGASIWLMPSDRDAVLLRGIITGLARRFGTPEFEPHLTLAGDLHDAPGVYIPLLDELAAMCAAFAQPIEDIVLTEAYFRAFYAAFGQTTELRRLRERCAASVGGTSKGFTPHVSLLYGSLPESEKQDAAGTIRLELHARRIVFDRVVVTNSSDNVPVNEWRICTSRALGG
jgi:2'-5' RNA ligase